MKDVKFCNRVNRRVLGVIFVISFVFGGVMVLSENTFGAAEPTDSEFQLVPEGCGNAQGTAGPTEDGGSLSDECGWADLLELISNVMQFLVYIAVSIGVLACCYAGFLYITAFGETGKIEQAHKIFSSAITGFLIILLAWLIVATILKYMDLSSADFTILNADLGDD